MARRRRDVTVGLTANVRVEHTWVARDGRAWAFRLVEVRVDGYPPAGTRVAVLVNEEDF